MTGFLEEAREYMTDPDVVAVVRDVVASDRDEGFLDFLRSLGVDMPDLVEQAVENLAGAVSSYDFTAHHAALVTPDAYEANRTAWLKSGAVAIAVLEELGAADRIAEGHTLGQAEGVRKIVTTSQDDAVRMAREYQREYDAAEHAKRNMQA